VLDELHPLGRVKRLHALRRQDQGQRRAKPSTFYGNACRRIVDPRSRRRANAGLGRSDVLAFWFGESDEVTPEPIRAAAAASLMAGETFYSHNLGLPELRQAIAAYSSALHGPLDAGRVAVTSSGVTALMLAMQMLAGAGDEVVVVVPVWPNLTAQPAILGATVRTVSLQPRADGAWALDLDQLLAASPSAPACCW
jgi:aspartate/methionine/tyrosine aminotransferase